jgi:hypothetical protein
MASAASIASVTPAILWALGNPFDSTQPENALGRRATVAHSPALRTRGPARHLLVRRERARRSVRGTLRRIRPLACSGTPHKLERTRYRRLRAPRRQVAVRLPKPATTRRFAAAGVEFIDENDVRPGVRLRKRVHKKPIQPLATWRPSNPPRCEVIRRIGGRTGSEIEPGRICG